MSESTLTSGPSSASFLAEFVLGNIFIWYELFCEIISCYEKSSYFYKSIYIAIMSLLFFNEQVFFFNFSALISNTVNVHRQNSHKQKFFGSSITFRSLKGFWDQKLWEPLLSSSASTARKRLRNVSWVTALFASVSGSPGSHWSACLPRPEIKPSCAACDNSTSPGAVISGENGLQCPGKPSKIPCKSCSELSNPHSIVSCRGKGTEASLSHRWM